MISYNQVPERDHWYERTFSDFLRYNPTMFWLSNRLPKVGAHMYRTCLEQMTLESL